MNFSKKNWEISQFFNYFWPKRHYFHQFLSVSRGSFSKSLISDINCDMNSPEFHRFQLAIPSFPEEGIYIYSFEQNRMIYVNNWKETLGYEDEEVNMLLLVNATTPEYAQFSNEMNDKALMFLMSRSENLTKYSFSIELKKRHKNGSDVPIIARVGVYEAGDGKIKSIIGRYQINRNLKFGKVMRYAAYGPEKDDFEGELNKMLFTQMSISDKERKTLSLLAAGMTMKQISEELNISTPAVEKRIYPLFERFNVQNLAHLIQFSNENNLI